MKKLIAKIVSPWTRANAIVDAAPVPSALPASAGVLTATPPVGSTVYLRRPINAMGYLTILPSVRGTVHASSLSRLGRGEMVVEWPGIGLIVHPHSDFAGLVELAS